MRFIAKLDYESAKWSVLKSQPILLRTRVISCVIFKQYPIPLKKNTELLSLFLLISQCQLFSRFQLQFTSLATSPSSLSAVKNDKNWCLIPPTSWIILSSSTVLTRLYLHDACTRNAISYPNRGDSWPRARSTRGAVSPSGDDGGQRIGSRMGWICAREMPLVSSTNLRCFVRGGRRRRRMINPAERRALS